MTQALTEYCLFYNGRYAATIDGRIYSVSSRRFLTPATQSRGYLTVALYDGSSPKKPRSFLVHRLIASAFLGASDLQINHKNGIKSDNRLENLEYVTQSGNIQHAIETLGQFAGERHGRAKLSNQQIEDIRNCGLPAKNIAVEYRITAGYVRDIKSARYRQRG
jgi:hypothetical protein